jgi:hypothetical protein
MWQDGRGAGLAGIYMQHYDSTGLAQWATDGIAVAVSPANTPRMISDGLGGAFVVWDDNRNGQSDVYAQHIDNSGAGVWTANGVAVTTATGNQRSQQLTSDGSGGVIIAFEDILDASDANIRARRVNSAGVAVWTDGGIAVCVASNIQGGPEITGDGAGGAVISWYDWRNGTNAFDIYAQRVDGDGAAKWTADGVAVCTATGVQISTAIRGNGSGDTFFSWRDNRSGNYDIYVQRLDSLGVSQWTPQGVPLCTALTDQLNPALADDGRGGLIVTWNDTRNGSTNADVFARRVDSLGVPQWTADGNLVCAATANQNLPQITSDGSNGAVICWRDFRNGSTNADIYAQRLDASGLAQWTLDGVAVSTATGNQQDAYIAGDGSGGGIIAWVDLRNAVSSYDIYAAHVGGFGVLPVSMSRYTLE